MIRGENARVALADCPPDEDKAELRLSPILKPPDSQPASPKAISPDAISGTNGLNQTRNLRA